MRKHIVVLVAALAVAFAATPAIASASTSSVTRIVGQQFSTQLHNRARLSGIRIISTTMKCAYDGGSRYSCYATYTASLHGYVARYGVYINVVGNGWRTVGNAVRI